MTAKISLRNVTKEFTVRATKTTSATRLTAIDSLSLDVRDGEFLTLVGPSGSGKTTLLDLLAGLSTPTSGEVLVNGKAVTGPGKDRAVVFQQYALFPWRTASANVSIGLEGGGPDGKKLIAAHGPRKPANIWRWWGSRASRTATHTSSPAA
nr:ATP-binding cassette domain-containing protein [Arthrobacter sp. ISL-95]